ncbi:hypothetical protein Syun_009891 [Stephania yunnanensis]|uniref:Uncharacterized protein n=1 Tax=Stephania yunnanensis TaxID=152371 RepID=A0AAP0PPG7_9MAGN
MDVHNVGEASDGEMGFAEKGGMGMDEMRSTKKGGMGMERDESRGGCDEVKAGRPRKRRRIDGVVNSEARFDGVAEAEEEGKERRGSR